MSEGKNQKKMIPFEIADLIVDNLIVGICVIDGIGKIINTNKVFEKISFIPREELIGKNIREFFIQQYVRSSAIPLDLSSKKPLIITFITKTNKKLLIHGISVLDKNLNVIFIVNTIFDISDNNYGLYSRQ